MRAPHSERGSLRRSSGRGRVPSLRRQRGVALLVAILLVALGTIIAAAMAYDNAMTARRAAASFDFDQALLAAEGAEALAAYGLQQTASQNPTYIGPGQYWSQPLPPTEVIPGVMLQASVEDLQGRFNINDLVETNGETPNPYAIAAFQRLLGLLGMDKKWADYLVDWIDKDSTPMFPEGAEDSVYMEMNPPYRTPNLPITSTSELMALPGFTRADFDRLAPYIVALPIGTKINTCSASAYVLDALTGVVQFSADSEFEKNRAAATTCFPLPSAVQQVANNSGTQGTTPSTQGTPGAQVTPGTQGTQGTLASLIGQTSSWFRLTSFVTDGATEFAVYTTLYQGPTHLVRPVMRSFTPN
jgi:general secretion pathway protein K